MLAYMAPQPLSGNQQNLPVIPPVIIIPGNGRAKRVTKYDRITMSDIGYPYRIWDIGHQWDISIWMSIRDMGQQYGIWYIDMVIHHIDMVILTIDMGYGTSIWEMTVSIWSSRISIKNILSL